MLIKELQSLALNIQVLDKDGNEVQLSDLVDDEPIRPMMQYEDKPISTDELSEEESEQFTEAYTEEEEIDAFSDEYNPTDEDILGSDSFDDYDMDL